MGRGRYRTRADPPAWARDRWRLLAGAACVGLWDIFYDPDRDAEAKAVCATCPVFDGCREIVDRTEEGRRIEYCHGVWAGETPRERVRRRGRTS